MRRKGEKEMVGVLRGISLFLLGQEGGGKKRERKRERRVLYHSK